MTIPPSNGLSTARSFDRYKDHQLWRKPLHGAPFLMDWGTEEALKQKLADFVIVPPEPAPILCSYCSTPLETQEGFGGLCESCGKPFGPTASQTP